MKEGLKEKIKLLSLSDVNDYYDRLYNILNDRYSFSVYGGINKKDYATLPKNSVEWVEQILYWEMFEGKVPLFLN
ncbi:MAG: hypothetical protein ABIE36_01270 [Candidatus Diapherotrites archaeon]